MTEQRVTTTDIIVQCTDEERKEIRATAKSYGITMSTYFLQLHENNKTMKDSEKEPTND